MLQPHRLERRNPPVYPSNSHDWLILSDKIFGKKSGDPLLRQQVFLVVRCLKIDHTASKIRVFLRNHPTGSYNRSEFRAECFFTGDIA
jgi:hypothetical protein